MFETMSTLGFAINVWHGNKFFVHITVDPWFCKNSYVINSSWMKIQQIS